MKMKYVHTDNPEHTPVNLKKIRTFHKRSSNGVPTINFYYNGGWCTWEFESGTERDKIYDNILAIEGVTNVNNLKL